MLQNFKKILKNSFKNMKKKPNILYNNNKRYKIIMQEFYIDDNGNKYNVDGKHVILDPSQREIEVANMLGKLYGGKIRIIPRVNEPENIKTPDYIIKNEKFDLKEISGNGRNTLYDAIGKQRRQANNFIFDISKTELSEMEVINQIKNIYNSKHRTWVDKIILIENKKILNIYKRG